MTLFRKTLSLCFLVTLAVSVVHAVTWTTIDAPGAASTQVLGINSNGDLVGIFTDTSNITHGFVYKAGVFTTLDAPSSTFTVARGINDSGTIAGYYASLPFGDAIGFIFDGVTYNPVSFPGFVDTAALGINNGGEVVGWYGNGGSNPDFHGFKWSNSTFSTIEVGGPGETILTGINNREYTTGYDPFSFVSFAINPAGKPRIFNFQGAGLANGLNDRQTLVGGNVDPNFHFGFRSNLNNTGYAEIRFPGASNTFCNGINNTGQIAGSYVDGSAKTHGFLRTP